MVLLKMDRRLRSAHSPEVDGQLRHTHEGMAHFARTGPDGRECRECINWLFKKGDYHRSGTVTRGTLKPQPCAKGTGQKIPYYVSSCKYFEENPTPPPISAPRKP